VVPLEDAVAALTGGPALPADALVITFDDGFLDFFDIAYPALASRKMAATVYVTTGALGDGAGSLMPPAYMMSHKHLDELDATVVEVGAHTRTHPQLDVIPRLAAAAEIAACKTELEDWIGRPVTAFAYPYGLSTPTVRALVRRAGYTSAAAVREGFSSSADDLFAIARLTVRADTPPETFTAWLHGTDARIAPFPPTLRAGALLAARRTHALLRRR
jgi:peptidoglycan/xylan/chitin deacetylase (PgdA/CDA1 family)